MKSTVQLAFVSHDMLLPSATCYEMGKRKTNKSKRFRMFVSFRIFFCQVTFTFKYFSSWIIPQDNTVCFYFCLYCHCFLAVLHFKRINDIMQSLHCGCFNYVLLVLVAWISPMNFWPYYCFFAWCLAFIRTSEVATVRRIATVCRSKGEECSLGI